MKVYFSEEEVREAAVAYFTGDVLAANVWMTKYALKEGDAFLEKTPKDSIKRYVSEFHRIENTYPNPLPKERIQELLEDYKYFIPAGSPMYGIGNTYELVSLGNCFVIGEYADSFGGIMAMDEGLAQIMKRRGGVGIDISHLRPKGKIVKNAAKFSSGAVSFMEKFSNTTRLIAQEGRRGALMITIDVNHPDIMDFITVKDEITSVTGANISVKITDDFMKAVELDSDFELKFEDTVLSIKARKIWSAIIHQAWKSAEPGVLFWDTIIKNSPADCYKKFQTISTNPCSELPLSPFDSCRLASMNIYSYVINPFSHFTELNWQKLYDDVFDSQRLMDDMIDLEEEKIKAILAKINGKPEKYNDREKELWNKVLESLQKGRRTGLGQTGLADAGAALGFIYGSPAFTEFAVEVQETITKASYASSIQMAKERGAFPEFDLITEENHVFIKRVLEKAPDNILIDYRNHGRRNIANLTIAPTGSLSILAKVSSGIEPVFMLEYNRRRKVNKDTPGAVKDDVGDYWEEYSVLHPKYQEYLSKTDNSTMSPYDLATAGEINYLAKVDMVGKMQQWIDHSISVTYNLPEDTPESMVSSIYLQAYKSGCKGVTVYREGSRDGVLVAKELKEKEKFFDQDAPKRPRSLPGEAFCTSVKGEKFTVIVGLLEGRPYEVFAYKGNGLSGEGQIIKVRKGSYKFVSEDKEEIITDDLTEEQEAITRGYSFGLRHGGHVKFAMEQLVKTKGDLSSFNKAIARVLKRFVTDGESSSELCPECKHRLIYESGCSICKYCGWGKCD